MTTTFDAHHIAVADEDTFFLVGFADQAFDTHAYVLIQRAYEYDEQDPALGMDTVYIERDNQNQSIYGGIEGVLLTSSAVRLSLSSEAAQALGSQADLHISITPTVIELQALRDGLRQICGAEIPLVIDRSVDSALVTE